ncbi:MAG: LysR family transcriptional regulator, partial [Hydrogenophaga sp.]|nr:LysR family transcriptional regulator [Hydrogenophaga sp.]
RLVLDFDAALLGVKDHVTRKRGRVTVALLPSLAANWMPGILAAFHARHPSIDLNLFDVLSDACIERVASGQADFAIAASCENTPTLQASEFCSDGFFLVCPSGHPLLTQEQVRAEDLAQWPFIHLARTSSVRQHFDAALYPNRMRTVMEVEQLATVMGMVRAGLGISVVPGLSLFHFERTGVAVRRLDLPGLRRTLYVIRPRDRSLSLAAQSLYEMMQVQRPCDDGPPLNSD